MNKYLEKIAKEVTKSKVGDYVGGTLIGAAGTGVVKHQYHEGNLTGRATYYHGSSAKNIRKIKNEGIIPRKSKGIIDHLGDTFKKENEGLAFATKTKFQAHHYARQSEAGRKASFVPGNGDDLRTSVKRHFKDSFGFKRDPRVVKVNLPTWKDEIKSKMVRNPELDHMGIFQNEMARRELAENTITHKGKIGAEYIRGSKHYKGNSAGEILSYIKKNPKRFAKGVGWAGVGAGIVGAAGHVMARKPEKVKT